MKRELVLMSIIFSIVSGHPSAKRSLKKAEKLDVIVAVPTANQGAPTLMYEDVQWGCFDGFEMNDVGLCIRELSTTARVGCPSDYILSSKTGLCEGGETIDALQVCPGGFLPSTKENMCERYDKTTKTIVCQNGYENVNGQCQKQVIGMAADGYNCPTGFEKDLKGRCLGYLYTASRKECPESYTELKGDECERYQLSSTMPVCIPGYELKYNTSCVKSASMQPGLVCSSGYILNTISNLCIRKEQSDRRAICNAGWTFDGLSQKCTCPTGKCETQVLQQQAAEPEPVIAVPVVPRVYGQGVSTRAMGTMGEGLLANNAEIVTITLPQIAPRTVYYPQYVVHGTQEIEGPPVICEKKKGCSNDKKKK